MKIENLPVKLFSNMDLKSLSWVNFLDYSIDQKYIFDGKIILY
jgi:hypothetical protein